MAATSRETHEARRMKDLDSVKEKYKARIQAELGGEIPSHSKGTSDYQSFKESLRPRSLSFYEKACNFAESILPVQPDKEQIPDIQEAIRIGHLNVTPTGTMSFAALVALTTILAGVFFGYIIPLALTGSGSIFVAFFGVVLAATLVIPVTKLPFIISNYWRMKASNQMVLSVFYVVTYMRHTPNLELAIDFSAEHLAPPLSLDFKKVMWDLETGRYETITKALDEYLETWRKYNPEFIEAMHLVESSLYESSESRRQSALDKSLDVILDETYEKMLHYTHNLKGPLNMLHMLGIILPVLGLIILPMVSAFIQETRWYHIMVVYNIFLPIVVYYLSRQILSTRPTGYGGVDLSTVRKHEDRKGETKVTVVDGKTKKPVATPLFTALFILGVFGFIGLSPIIIHQVNPSYDVLLTEEGVRYPNQIDPDILVYARLLDYQDVELDSGETVNRGPYGVGSTVISVFIPLALGLSLGYYNKLRSGKYIELRDETKELEEEFGSALFQLGNRLGDGVPAEIAFSNVSNVMTGTKSGRFFDLVSSNIARMGMGVEQAIFDEDVGAIHKFPSNIIESSMKVFLQSVKKGPMVASQALLGVAQYVKSMHRVDERLQDLMADILSSMKTQASVLTPVISGIVVGITSLITQLLSSLTGTVDQFAGDQAGVQGASLLGILSGGGVPNYFFQGVVGVYVVQITYILSVLINGIQNGNDETYKMHILGKNLIRSVTTYSVIMVIFTIALSFISSSLLSSIQ